MDIHNIHDKNTIEALQSLTSFLDMCAVTMIMLPSYLDVPHLFEVKCTGNAVFISRNYGKI